MRRRIASLVIIVTLIALFMPLPSQAEERTIGVTLDGHAVPFDVPPTIVDGRTLVPLRAIFEALGAQITWDDATKTVRAVRSGVTVVLTVGSATAQVGDRTVVLDVPAQIVGGRTLVPVRFVAEAMGVKVNWDPAARTVVLNSGPATAGPGSSPAIACTEPAADSWPAGITPATAYPKPFEPNYFPGLKSPRVVATAGSVEVTTDDSPLTFHYPPDDNITRTIMVRNTGPTPVKVDFTDFAMDIFAYDADSFINHPQPWRLYLDPGESHPILLRYGYGGLQMVLDGVTLKKGSTFPGTLTVKLAIYQQGSSTPTASIPLTFQNTVIIDADVLPPPPGGGGAQTQSGPRPIIQQPNATIAGTVTLAGGKQPAPGVTVQITDGWEQNISVKTDQLGRFTAGVFAYQRNVAGIWNQVTVRVKAGDTSATCADAVRLLQPEPGTTTDVQIEVGAARVTADYQLTGTMPLALSPYVMDGSDDGQVIATVPFHNVGAPETLVRDSYLTVFNQDGDLLWRHPLNGQTPALDVSDDGSLVATSVTQGDTGLQAVARAFPVVFDRSGKQLMQFTPPPTAGSSNDFKEVRLSHNDRYLATGDGDGNLFLVDVATGNSLWTAFTEGQVRYIQWEKDDSRIYVSSGSGFLDAYDLKGNRLWRTYTDAWAMWLDVSEHYLLITSKAGDAALHLVEKATGKILWSYPEVARGREVHIAPDESYLWFGTDIGSGSANMIFRPDGTPVVGLPVRGNSARITPDSQFILVGGNNEVGLYDRLGDQLWSYASTGQMVWISRDGSRIVVSNGKWGHSATSALLFFQGAIKRTGK